MSNQAEVRNELSGIGGHGVQAGAIHGDVHFHQQRPGPGVPRQLPSAARHFTNRQVEQDWLTTMLLGPATGDRLLISSIDGTAGIGKTSLAVHWAHEVRERFGDGELYANLRGFDPSAEPVHPRDALGTFLAALDVPPERVPDDVDARSALFRSLLHGRRVLLLLDNAHTAEQVRPLLPASPTCLVLVTSRNRLQDLVVREGAQRMTLDLLTPEKSRELLATHLGEERLDAEPDAAAVIVEHCGGLPLALGIVAYRAAEDPEFPLAELVDELRDERARLDALDAGGQTGVRAVLSWSYRRLSEESARTFGLLGLPTGDDIGLAAAADLAGTTQRQARAQLTELTRAHLVDQHAPGRYRFHDLLRAYAAERANTDETAEQRTAALRRLFDHYLLTSARATKLLTSHTTRLQPEPPDSDVVGLTFDDGDSALNWWDTEHANLVAASQQASQYEYWEHAWQLPTSLMYFFHLRGHTSDWIECLDSAIPATRKVGDRTAEANLLGDLGIAHYDRREYELAIDRFRLAHDLASEIGDNEQLLRMLVTLSETNVKLERYEEAAATANEVLELSPNSDDKGLAHAMLAEGSIAAGKPGEAFPHLDKALEHFHEGGERIAVGYALHLRGKALLKSGDAEAAVTTHQQAVEHRRGIGHKPGTLQSLCGLGEALRSNGDVEGARELLNEALALSKEFGQSEVDRVRRQLRELD